MPDLNKQKEVEERIREKFPPKPTYLQRILRGIKGKGDELIDKGVEWAAEKGYPDAGAAVGAAASAANELFMPTDEKELAMAMLPYGKVTEITRHLGGGAVERALHYESQAERLARKAREAEKAPTINYEKLKEALTSK